MKRNSFLDNYKAILIVLVVLTHFTGALAGQSNFFKAFEIFNNLFYMPAFIMISGYLSKHNDLIKIIKSLLIPYVFIQILNILFDIYITNRSETISLVSPKFTLWYLLSLFFWKVTVKYISRFKCSVFLLIIISMVIGYDQNVGTVLSLSRTVFFYPYFLFGYLLTDFKIVLKYKNRIMKIVSILILCMIFYYCYRRLDLDILKLLTGANSYKKMDMLSWGWLSRLMCYIIGFAMTYFIAILIPNRSYFFTQLGKKTMSIYLFHGIIYQFIQYKLHVYQYINTWNEYLLFIVLILFLIWLLSTKPFVEFAKKLSSIPIEKIYKKGEIS